MPNKERSESSSKEIREDSALTERFNNNFDVLRHRREITGPPSIESRKSAKAFQEALTKASRNNGEKIGNQIDLSRLSKKHLRAYIEILRVSGDNGEKIINRSALKRLNKEQLIAYIEILQRSSHNNGKENRIGLSHLSEGRANEYLRPTQQPYQRERTDRQAFINESDAPAPAYGKHADDKLVSPPAYEPEETHNGRKNLIDNQSYLSEGRANEYLRPTQQPYQRERTDGQAESDAPPTPYITNIRETLTPEDNRELLSHMETLQQVSRNNGNENRIDPPYQRERTDGRAESDAPPTPYITNIRETLTPEDNRELLSHMETLQQVSRNNGNENRIDPPYQRERTDGRAESDAPPTPYITNIRETLTPEDNRELLSHMEILQQISRNNGNENRIDPPYQRERTDRRAESDASLGYPTNIRETLTREDNPGSPPSYDSGETQ